MQEFAEADKLAVFVARFVSVGCLRRIEVLVVVAALVEAARFVAKHSIAEQIVHVHDLRPALLAAHLALVLEMNDERRAAGKLVAQAATIRR